MWAKVTFDLTEAERALHESESRFRSVFDQAPIGMARVALDGSWLEVNPPLRAFLGYSEAELLQTTFQALSHPEDLAADLDLVDATLAGEIDSYTMEKRYFHKQGHVVRALLTVSLVRDREGRPLYFVSQQKDINDRKQAQLALAASEVRYRDLFENASDALYSLDAKGRITDANRACELLTGYTREQMLGRPIADIFVASSGGRARRRLAGRLMGQGGHGTFECTITSKDGTAVELEIASRPILAKGRLAAIQGVARDIGERKSLEQERRLGQKLEAVGRLAGGIAHDFNNMLTAIIGHTDLALNRIQDPGPRADVIEIRRAAEQAAALTRQLLAFGRKQVLAPQVLDLNAIVASTEAMLRRLIGAQITFDTKLEPDLGYVTADPTQLEQVIVNLVVNARDAMPSGGRLLIETRNLALDEQAAKRHPPVRPGDYTVLTVTDTGRGIDAKTRRRLFEPFFTTKEPGQGTGLGLATAYGIVTQSRGFIRVDSVPGAGARFTVYLPRTREPLQRVAAPPPAYAPERERIAATILIAEDDEVVRKLLTKTLEAAGHTVLGATCAEEALELAFQAGPRRSLDLVITDVVMPGLDGPELLRKLREQLPRLPAIYISGHSEDAIARHGKLTPGAVFVQKPFTPQQLAATVDAVLTV